MFAKSVLLAVLGASIYTAEAFAPAGPVVSCRNCTERERETDLTVSIKRKDNMEQPNMSCSTIMEQPVDAVIHKGSYCSCNSSKALLGRDVWNGNIRLN